MGYSVQDALLGEVITTFTMVSLLCVFLGFRQTRPYTPAIFPHPVFNHEPAGGKNLWSQYKSCKEFWPRGNIRNLGSLVDILYRTAYWRLTRKPGLQYAGKENYRGETLSFRQRPRWNVQEDEFIRCKA